MKEAKRKNKENLIGKIIYGFLLFMPLIAMAITCAYAIFNKNAYKSFKGNAENIYYSQVEFENLEYGKDYVLEINTNTTWTGSITFYFENMYYYDNNNLKVDMSNFSAMNLYNSNNFSIRGNGQNNVYISVSNINSFHLTWNGYTLNNNFTSNITYLEVINEIPKDINNVFYYSIDKVEQSNLFNWPKDTGMYTTVHGATELLGIRNTFIPMLLSYWLLISVIYIVYDIALIGVHMVHNKIHDFENVI